MKKLYNANSDFEANQLKGMLEAAGVNCEVEATGYTGGSRMSLETRVHGVNVYVNESDETVANEVLQQYLFDLKYYDSSDDLKIPWYKNRRIMERIFLAVVVLIWVAVIICMKLFG